MKAQIIIPLTIWLIVGLIITVAVIALLYGFFLKENISSTFYVYKIISDNNITELLTSFNSSSVQSITIQLATLTNITLSGTQLIGTTIHNGTYINVYNINTKDNLTINNRTVNVAAIIIVKNGKSYAAKVVDSMPTVFGINKVITFIQIELSNYFPQHGSIDTANVITNINNATFNYYLNNVDLTTCTTDTCSFTTPNTGYNSTLKVVASNKTTNGEAYSVFYTS
jgi:hypothetical protein